MDKTFFNARRVLLMYRHFTYQKGDLICLQFSELIFFTDTHYVILSEM